MNKTEYAKIMANRGNFYRFLSRLFEKEVSGELLAQLSGMTFPGGNLSQGAEMMASFVADADAQQKVEVLAADFAKVFLGAGETNGKAAYPYESVYTSKEGLIMQQAWQDVKALYAQSGLNLQTAMADIKEDHLAVELQYMAFLADNDQAGSSLAKQKAFVQQHLLNWVPAFLADVEKYAQTSFYQGVAKMTAAFLADDLALLEALMEEPVDACSYFLTGEDMDQVLAKLKERYKVYAPKLLPKRGPQGRDVVRYQEVSHACEIVHDRPSDFSAKEVYYPVIQTMIHFTETECKVSCLKDDRDILIFLRACDINGMGRLDNIFLKNGGNADLYYKRLRDKVKIVLMECSQSYENCFCVSMGTNKTELYDLAVRFDEGGVSVRVKTQEFQPYFQQHQSSDYQPAFVEDNDKKVRIPVIEDTETLKLASSLEYWKQYDNQCIGCGGCNTVCPTCSCFDTVDVIYNETSREGERRRVWSSCMLDTFTMTAGGNRARKTAGANMRFKTLHKVYDYRKRFGNGENMCVGCGRCINQCPEHISFYEVVNGFHDALEQAKGGQK